MSPSSMVLSCCPQPTRLKSPPWMIGVPSVRVIVPPGLMASRRKSIVASACRCRLLSAEPASGARPVRSRAPRPASSSCSACRRARGCASAPSHGRGGWGRSAGCRPATGRTAAHRRRSIPQARARRRRPRRCRKMSPVATAEKRKFMAGGIRWRRLASPKTGVATSSRPPPTSRVPKKVAIVTSRRQSRYRYLPRRRSGFPTLDKAG